MKIYILFFLIVFSLFSCKEDKDITPTEKPHPSLSVIDTFKNTLSEMQFFYGEIKNLQPTDNVVAYELLTPLFSDYAEKARFIYFPKDSKATYTTTGVLDFPEGCVIIKNFYFFQDFRDKTKNKRIYETRLLLKRSNKWLVASYIWNTTQTEAYLNENVDGTTVPISWIDKFGISKSTDYYIPSSTDCIKCHESSGDIVPIGPKVRNINRDNIYKGVQANQLDYLSQRGFLEGMPTVGIIPKIAAYDNPATGSLELRARSYLDINCGHCHNTNGIASTSGLLLDFEALRSEIGICKIADRSVGSGLLYDIIPRNADSSLMVYRMHSNAEISRMPSIGRSIVHQEGIDLIREWIGSLDDPNCR